MYIVIGSSLFWAVTQRRMAVSCQCLRTTYRTHLLKASPLKSGLICCPETEATKYKCTLHNIAAQVKDLIYTIVEVYNHTQKLLCLEFLNILMQVKDSGLQRCVAALPD
jgi:hypothetical protein